MPGGGRRRRRCSHERCALATHRDDHALLPLPVLALLIGVHVKTLRAAARDGRLPVTYDTRTTFRRLRARATPAAARAFRRSYYGRTVRPDDRRARLTWATRSTLTTTSSIRALRAPRPGPEPGAIGGTEWARRGKPLSINGRRGNARRRPCSGKELPRSTGVSRSARKRERAARASLYNHNRVAVEADGAALHGRRVSRGHRINRFHSAAGVVVEHAARHRVVHVVRYARGRRS